MANFQNILFVVENKIDFNTFGHAIRLAKHQKAKLTFIDAIEKPTLWAATPDVQSDWDRKFGDMLANRRKLIERAVKPHLDELTITVNVLEGKIYLEAIRSVLTHGHDLVIKHTDVSQNLVSRIFGSQDMRLLRLCPCPVLITSPNWDGKFKHILAAVDFENPNDVVEDTIGNLLNKQILETAMAMTSREGSNLDVVHVFPVLGFGIQQDGGYGLQETETATYIKHRKPGFINLLNRLLMKLKKWVGDDLYNATVIKPHIFWGNPNIEIPKQSKRLQSDLIVMGTVARTGVSGFIIGNTAELILENIECSVLAFKPDGFVSPVKL
jgi:nucleotide-binding universal stress UspA family protein